MSFKIIISVAGSLLTIISLSLLLVYLSLWHLWALVPDGDLKMAINRQQPGAALAEPYLWRQYPELEILRQTRRYAFSRTASHLAIAAEPLNLSAYQRLKQELEKSGWRAESKGLIITATRGDGPGIRKLSSSYPDAIMYLLARDLPRRPLATGHLSNGLLPALNSDLNFIATAQNTSPHPLIKISLAGNNFSLPLEDILPKLPENNLQLALPSYLLANLPSSFKIKLNQELTKYLPYSRVQPDLISALGEQTAFSLKLANGQLAITVSGNPDLFHQQVITWTEAEEAYSRPEREAFLLPDGTMAYRFIAGPKLNSFQTAGDCEAASWLTTPNETPGSSSSTLRSRVEIWLCKNNGNQLTFSPDRSLAQSPTSNRGDPIRTWSAQIPTAYLSTINPHLVSIFAQGESDQAQIYIWLNDK